MACTRCSTSCTVSLPTLSYSLDSFVLLELSSTGLRVLYEIKGFASFCEEISYMLFCFLALDTVET